MRISKFNIEKLSRATLVFATLAVALLAAGFSSGLYAADHSVVTTPSAYPGATRTL